MATARIEIDWGACAGHARCCALAPDLFGTDDEDRVVIKRQPVTASDLDEVEKAAQACPEGAILIHRTD
jgi:ferredoxin